MKNLALPSLLTLSLHLPMAIASEASDKHDIEQALLTCSSSRPQDCRPKGELIVKILKLNGDLAKASISSRDGSGEADIAYLKKIGGHWQVLDQGTGIDPRGLDIPGEMW